MRALIRRVRRGARRAGRLALRAVLAFALATALWVSAYRWVDPPITALMVMEWIRLGDLERDWRPLDEISPHLVRAVMAAEDARFCGHFGFDLTEIRNALAEEGRRRGASTITQQTAKNVFLWPDASWVRKGLEAGFTVLIELLWPKARTMEVYLNVAEFGPGVFGAEAGARRAFGVGAGALSRDQAARLAAVLPSPRRRTAGGVSAARAAVIADGAATLQADGRAACAAPEGED